MSAMCIMHSEEGLVCNKCTSVGCGKNMKSCYSKRPTYSLEPGRREGRKVAPRGPMTGPPVNVKSKGVLGSYGEFSTLHQKSGGWGEEGRKGKPRGI